MRDSLIIGEERVLCCFDRTLAVCSFSSHVVRRFLHLRCSGVKESSLRAGKLISSCSQGLRLPSVGCLVDAAAWLDGRGRLKKMFPPFFEAEDLTQLNSRGCRYRLVDASVNRVLPREVAQAVKGSNDTRFYGVGSGDVGKELPWNKSVLCVLFVGEPAHIHDRELSQNACSFRG